MEGIYGWVSNIVYYMIFFTMLIQLLPAGKYEKYLKLFSGCILILLVIKPVTGGLRLEEKMAEIFKTLSFVNDAGELKADLENMEGKRLDALITRYEAAAAEDIGRMVYMKGYDNQQVDVRIDRSDSPDFGKIREITLLLREEAQEEEVVHKETVVQEWVEPVKIQIGNEGKTFKEETPVYHEVMAPGNGETKEIKRLRTEIAEYYQVEEEYVEIRFEDE